MAHKARTKPVNNVSTALTFRASNAMQQFLAVMNQNHCMASMYKLSEYTQLVPIAWRSTVMDNLMQMKFKVILEDNPNTTVPALPQPEVADSQIDKDDIHEIIDAFKIVGPWCKKFTPTIACDDTYNELKRLVGLIADLFDLIPGPHQCPTPIPPPPPCSCPHCDDEDTPMEPPAPTCVFSEAASQTPAPSHEAIMPSPLPAAAATSPAAAASTPPAGPRSHASYAGAAAKNLNPAAPPFVCGPPRAPVAKPPAQDQQPVSSSRSAEVGAQLQCSIIPSDYICGSTFPTRNEALAPLNSLAATSFSMKQRFSSKGRKPTLERLSVSVAGIGVITLRCVADQRYAAPSALALIRRLVTVNSQGVAEVTPRSLPPSHPLQRTCLACMSTLHCFNRSWIRDQAIWDTSACKGVPPPPSTPCGNKPLPCDRTLRPPQQGAPQLSLPPIHEDDEGDDDDMALFGLMLDNDYNFHK
ncbi:hypothetical protein P691DRAFT_764661 [Macrolepiota fuliginosa MF-IS2]|uniref:Uncharacterized protein n=1 Tax=Macrolepiota fuliginosa MF-IS2 TaxID=1400762 RepID=A0A9P6BYV2_9AGAR|nr:hypothetical protein P691DRAFT_764661 [Macrolepiota fuliginosa MF-IS2]